ncbi:MAG: restriction endonuclease [Rhizobiaceae bacterium]
MKRYWRRQPADNIDRRWKDFERELNSVEYRIKSLRYESVITPTTQRSDSIYEVGFYTIRADGNGDTVSLSQINSALAPENLGPPLGSELLQVPRPPEFPELPQEPEELPEWNKIAGQKPYAATKARELSAKLAKLRQSFEETYQIDLKMMEALRLGYSTGDPKYVELLASLSLTRHYLPAALRRPSNLKYDEKTRTLLCEIEVPNFANIKIQKPKAGHKYGPANATERKKALENFLFASAVRAGYLCAHSDIDHRIDLLAVNVQQQWFDPATGNTREGVIASLQALKADFFSLRPGHIDPKACFFHLKGIATPSVERTTPIRPIFYLDTKDSRVVENRDVANSLAATENLAAIPWEDFEHLVRQLFEWEFGRSGVEVKVTRASRDRGVDAIMFDPDPLRGGKYVLQAKRYTRTVDVASVRDLYGTVMNEGANRGILVTTSSFGPDAYEFAKDKPLSLVDGPNLIAMLQRHGRDYRIDLAEARNLGAATND